MVAGNQPEPASVTAVGATRRQSTKENIVADNIRPTEAEVAANRAETRAALEALGIKTEQDIIDRRRENLEAELEGAIARAERAEARVAADAVFDREVRRFRDYDDGIIADDDH